MQLPRRASTKISLINSTSPYKQIVLLFKDLFIMQKMIHTSNRKLSILIINLIVHNLRDVETSLQTQLLCIHMHTYAKKMRKVLVVIKWMLEIMPWSTDVMQNETNPSKLLIKSRNTDSAGMKPFSGLRYCKKRLYLIFQHYMLWHMLSVDYLCMYFRRTLIIISTI